MPGKKKESAPKVSRTRSRARKKAEFDPRREVFPRFSGTQGQQARMLLRYIVLDKRRWERIRSELLLFSYMKYGTQRMHVQHSKLKDIMGTVYRLLDNSTFE